MNSVTLDKPVDAWTDDNNPTKRNPSTPRIQVSNAANKKYGWQYWGLPFPIGATIVTAKLRLYGANASAGSTTLTVKLPSKKWRASRINANTAPTSFAAPSATLTQGATPAGGLWEIDVLTLLQSVSSGTPWFGFRIAQDQTGTLMFYSADNTDASLRPQLYIEWLEATEQPEALRPGDGLVVSAAKSYFLYEYIDPEGDDQVSQQIRLYPTEADALAHTNITFDTGDSSTNIPEWDSSLSAWAGLADAASIWWRCRAKDIGNQWTPWSDPTTYTRRTKGTLTITSPSNPGAEILRNKITNPSFETNTTGWSGLGTGVTLTRITTDSYHGVACCQVDCPGTVAAEGIQLTPDITVTGNTTYSVTHWFKAPAGKTMRLRLVETTGGSNGVNTDVVATGQWQSISATLTTGAGVTTLDTRLYETNETAAITFWIDSSILVQSATPPTTFWTGDTVPTYTGQYAWVGTANASESILRDPPALWEGSPTITWTFTGRTQTQYRLQVYLLSNLKTALWDSGWTASTATSRTIPFGILQPGNVYRVILQVLDEYSRESLPGDPSYTQATMDCSINFDAAVADGTGLSMASDALMPVGRLAWTKLSAPNGGFQVLRSEDGGVTWYYLAEFTAVDSLINPGGNIYGYNDNTAPPYKALMWRVVSVNNGHQSVGLTVSGQVRRLAPFLYRDNGKDAVCFINPQRSMGFNDVHGVHEPMSGASIVVTQKLGKMRGHVEGRFTDDAMPGSVTADQMLARFLRIREAVGERVYVAIANKTFEAYAYNFTYDILTDASGITYQAGFDWIEAQAKDNG